MIREYTLSSESYGNLRTRAFQSKCAHLRKIEIGSRTYYRGLANEDLHDEGVEAS